MTNKIHTRHLGPINDSIFEENYEPFLNYAFETPEIHNIAITAPRGAGKSSVLNTYLTKKGKNNEVLNITVGSFEKNEPNVQADVRTRPVVHVVLNDSDNKDSKNLGQEIETKILNQIIQQIDPKTIPESRFHIDREHNPKKTRLRALFVSIAFICVVYLTLFSNYDRKSVFVEFQNNPFTQKVMNFLYNPITLIVVLLILAIVVFSGVIVFFKNYTNKRIPKFTLKDCSLDPVDDNQDTIFNKYLDEILYMLMRSGFKTLIFEDLDRLNDYTIWEKLREINIILNKRINIFQRREAAAEQKKAIRKKKRENIILIKLYLKIKNYIQSKNARNKQYANQQAESNGKPSHIKFIYVMNDSLFKSKDRVKFFDYIIPIIPVVDKSNSMDKLMDISKKYFKLSQSFLGSINNYIDDMRLIYNVFNEMSVYKMQLNPTQGNAEELIDDKLFAFVLYKNMLPNDYEQFQYYDGIVYKILSKFEAIRQTELKNCTDDVIMRQSLLYAQPDDFAHSHNQTTDELYQIISEDVKEQLDEWTETERALIQCLIMNGYLTIEDTQYVSYFYKTNMNNKEREFVLKVKHNQPVDVNQKLEHVNFVARSLGRYLEYGNILNCDLVYYLLKNDKARESNVYELIKSSKDYKFIDAFIKYLRHRDIDTLYDFIQKLNNTWEQVFKEMVEKSMDNLCLIYSQLSLCHCDINVINRINCDHCLTKYLNTVTSLRSA